MVSSEDGRGNGGIAIEQCMGISKELRGLVVFATVAQLFHRTADFTKVQKMITIMEETETRSSSNTAIYVVCKTETHVNN